MPDYLFFTQHPPDYLKVNGFWTTFVFLEIMGFFMVSWHPMECYFGAILAVNLDRQKKCLLCSRFGDNTRYVD
jgi:hypothetical protein